MFGQRLKLARKRAGLSMRGLADLMDPKITAQAISKYEAGKMMPSSATLVGLGKALDVSLDFLMGGQVGKLDRLEFRKHAGTLVRDRARAEAIVIDSLENYFAVEEILGIKQPGDAFSDIRCDYIASEDEIDAKADALRSAWDLGMDPIPSMCALLEEKGIHVIEADLPESINGLACHALRTRADAPETEVIVVSTRTNVERKRFTLAHELAHRIIHATGNPAIKLESAMNRFAGALLVPGKHLVKEVGSRRHRITYYEIIRLKQIYGVSAAALLLRLSQVGILPDSAVQRAFATFARAWRTTEPEPIGDNEGFGAFEKPYRFKSLVWRAVGEELISPIRAAQFLHQSLEDIESRIRGLILQ